MVDEYKKYVQFNGRVLIIGFGSIGQAVLPLILRHIGMSAKQICIISKDSNAANVADVYGVRFIQQALTRENYQDILRAHLSSGDFLLNLSVDVSSIDLIKYCAPNHILYLDTCIEPWAGGYTDESVPFAQRSNYMFRETMLALRDQSLGETTAVITHGANPGLVSHLVKQALMNIAHDTGMTVSAPDGQQAWAQLASDLKIKAIHIAERDTQTTTSPKKLGEFVNTWSIDGFVSEGAQPAELGWGSHERHLPADAGRHTAGCQSAIYLNRPGAATRVRTWTPEAGSFHGFLITHGESISIADYLTLRTSAGVLYRPTVHYAYHPCEHAVLSLHEFAGREWQLQENKRLLFDEIVTGSDELGVLLMGHAKGAYWYGSNLSIEEARALVPYNNATSLQVAISVLAGMIWAMVNPNAGLVEPEGMDYRFILDICMPYLGKVSGSYTDWTPLKDRGRLFPEEIDASDPWQFINMRVA